MSSSDNIIEFRGKFYNVTKTMERYSLSLEEVRRLVNLNTKNIDANGRYVDLSLESPLIFDLMRYPKGTKYIKFLRDFHSNDKIARNVIIPVDVYVTEKDLPKIKEKQDKREFKLMRDQEYNNGHSRVRGNLDLSFGKKVIIGGVLVVVLATGLTYSKPSKTNNFNDKNMIKIGGIEVSQGIEEEWPSVKEYMDYILDDNNLKIASNDKILEMVERSEALKEIDSIASKRQKLVEKYANIYHVDYDRVYNKLVELTDNFESEDYLNNFHITGVTCKGVDVYGTSEEEIIALFVRCCKQLPEQLGFTSSVCIDSDYVSPDNYVEQVGEYAQLMGADPCLVYAIIKSESNFNSEMFKTKNNPAGIRNSKGKFWEFSTAEEGIIETALEINKLKDRGYDTIEGLGDIYAPIGAGDDPSNLNKNWIGNVSEFYLEAENSMDELFPNLEEENIKKFN